jgi:hypothetical protein
MTRKMRSEWAYFKAHKKLRNERHVLGARYCHNVKRRLRRMERHNWSAEVES